MMAQFDKNVSLSKAKIQQSTSGSYGQGRIFPGGASPVTCILSPRRLAEGLPARDGGASGRTVHSPLPGVHRLVTGMRELARLNDDKKDQESLTHSLSSGS